MSDSDSALRDMSSSNATQPGSESSRIALPNDLLPAIALYLAQTHDYQTLRSLQLVSRFAWTAATPHLYAHVSLATDKQWESVFGIELLGARGTDVPGLDDHAKSPSHVSAEPEAKGGTLDGRERLRYALSYVRKLEIRGLPPIGFDTALGNIQSLIADRQPDSSRDPPSLLPHVDDILLSLGEFPYADLYTGSRETQKRLDTLARMFDTDGLISPKRMCIQGGYRCHHYRLTIHQMTRRWKALSQVIFHDTHINIVDQLYIPGVENRLYLDSRQMASFSADTEDKIKDAIECHAGREVSTASSWRVYGNPSPDEGGYQEKLAVGLARGFTSSSLAFVSTMLDKEGHGSRHVEETLKGWGQDGTRWVYTGSGTKRAPPCLVCYRKSDELECQADLTV